MLTTRIAATIALTLALAAPATAAPLSARVAADYKIADHQWPQSGCVGRERIVWDGTATLSAWTELGDTLTCAIHIEPELRDPAWSPELCKVIVHEAGHLAGRLHSSSRASIMWPDATLVHYRPCEPKAPAAKLRRRRR